MKRAVILILAIIVLGSSFAVYYKIQKDRQIQALTDECTDYSDQNRLFTAIVHSKITADCDSLQFEQYRKRCKAYIENDPSMCQEFDMDCKAIAGKNESLCSEPICRAMATGNLTYCQEIPDAKWCEQAATLEPEAFPRNEQECKEKALETVKELS